MAYEGKVSFASINESFEIEYNNFNSIIESFQTLKEADELFRLKNKLRYGKTIFIEKMKVLVDRIKTWIDAIKLKLIDYFDRVIVKKAKDITTKANKLAGEGKVANIKDFKIAVLSLSKVSKDDQTINISNLDSVSRDVSNIKVVNDLKSFIMNTKFILDDIDTSKTRGKIGMDMDKKLNQWNTDKDSTDLVYYEVDPSITESQKALKNYIKENFNNLQSFPLQYHKIELNNADTDFVVNKFTKVIDAKIEEAKSLSAIYNGILKRKAIFEKAFMKLVKLLDAVLPDPDNDFPDDYYWDYGIYVKDDIDVLKQEAGLFCGLYTGYMKEIIANCVILSKMLYTKEDKSDDQLQKDAADLKITNDNMMEDLKNQMKEESIKK